MYPTQRFVDHDNSCLFSSIAYLLESNFDNNSKYKYRQLLINYLETKDIDMSILGTTKEDYINQMLDINTWGGAIELKLFSELFETEIVSFDIQFNRADTFGAECNSMKERGEYVDLSNSLNLKCSSCGCITQSQEDAAEHGVNFGHWEFEEIK